MRPGLLLAAGVTVTLCGQASAGVNEAVAYLEVEVPRWKIENKCYSCHNNGDGARALFLAGGKREPLEDTLRYLRDPNAWAKDLAPLALIQYANALVASGETGEAFQAAVQRVAAAQKSDGHWEMDAEAAAGSPVTYGPVLGTVLARQLLIQAKMNVQAATKWLESRQVDHPMDLAALVLALHRKADVDRLVGLQAKDGSWNGSEAFDTSIAVIALQKDAPDAAAKGRAWLIRNQLEPGGWRGTTRPAGGQSYAQHISTTAWALQALLTDPKP